jgi:RNA polymerase sigma factor for flagellar operon FliA
MFENGETPAGGTITSLASRSVEYLWSAYATSRTVADRNRLVIYYSPLVRVVASRVFKRVGAFQSLEELCSCGQFGLIDAVEKFDASEGFQFATYASMRIQGAIFDELRRNDTLPKRARARVSEFHKVRESLTAELRHSPTLNDVAKRMDTTLTEVVELADMSATSSSLTSLTDSTCSGRYLTCPRPEPSESAELAATRSALTSALQRITERQRQVLVLHYLEGFQKSEVADALGIDRSRVTQLLQQGLHNLRVELTGQGFLDPVRDLVDVIAGTFSGGEQIDVAAS